MPDQNQSLSTECCPATPPTDPLAEAFPLFVILLAIAWFYSRRNLIKGVATVISGNRLIVNGKKIRLYAMFGLYPNQPWYDSDGNQFDGGMKSKAALTERVDGREVKCWLVPGTEAIYGSKLCRVYFDGDDVGEWMVRQGHAVAVPSFFPKQHKLYVKAERRAKKEKLGLHRGKFDHPYIWYLNGFRNSEELKASLDMIERHQLEDDELDWLDLAKWGGRLVEAAGDGGISLAPEVIEWLSDL